MGAGLSRPRRVLGAVFRAFLTAFYYVALTPYAWLLRALGVPLPLLGPDGRDSYWVKRSEKPDRERYLSEF